jgi:hypothetical protein
MVFVVRAVLIGAGAFVVVLFGVGAPAAGALTLDPPPVKLGPVTVDPHVSVDPNTGLAIDSTTQLPGGSSPSVSVDVGPDGAHVSGPAGVAVTVTTPTTAGASSAPEPPAVTQTSPSPQATSSAAATATRTQSARATDAGSTVAPHADAATHTSAAASHSTSHVTRPRAESTAATLADDATVNGSVVKPHASEWSKLAPDAQRIAPFIALLALAFFLRVIVSAWTRDVRRRRALSAS